MGDRPDLTEILERVLAEPRFAAPSESWWDRFWARVLAEVVGLIGRIIEAVGGPVVAAFIALAIVGAVALFVAYRLAGRRASVLDERITLERLLRSGVDPDRYLHDAEEASRRGDHTTAVRLRFLGGVLEMARTGRIRFEPGLTTEGIAQQLDDPTFDTLATQFDAIAYGNRTADAEEDERSHRSWTQLRSSV